MDPYENGCVQSGLHTDIWEANVRARPLVEIKVCIGTSVLKKIDVQSRLV